MCLADKTKTPTLSYGLAEARGDLLSKSDGIWGNAEFGYDPLSNNLGASASAGTANSANIAGSDNIGVGPGKDMWGALWGLVSGCKDSVCTGRNHSTSHD